MSMKIRVQKPRNLTAEVSLPASKSISNRALLLAALSGAPTSALTNISDCDDTRAMLAGLSTKDCVVNIGAAGTAMRFLTAWLSMTSYKVLQAQIAQGEHIITGSERMRQRPIGVLVEALRSLGAWIEYVDEEGYPPLHIKAKPLHGGQLSLPGNVSSQYVSALLMIAPLLEEGLRLSLTGKVVSRPYIEMTMAMMRDFGADVSWQDERTVVVAPQPYHAIRYTIESDWSAASYWYETVLLSDNEHETATLKGLFDISLQGDSAVRDLFSSLGIQSMPLSQGSREPRISLVRRGTACQRLDWDFTRTPDLVQTLVVACALKGIPFRFTGVQSLRIKETDRIAALQTELAKLGVSLENEGDSVLRWEGPEQQPRARVPYLKPASGTAIDTYDDHRMAMAFAPAAFVLGSIDINNPEVVTKSYPRFWQDLEQAGFILEQL